MNLLKVIAHFWPILNTFFESFQNFVISLEHADYYEKFNKIRIRV